MKRNAFTKIELLVVIAIIVMLAGLLLPAIMGTRLTEETMRDLRQMRPFLHDLDFDRAIRAAEKIRQKAGRELAFYEIVSRQLEAERFEDAQKGLPKIGSSYHRSHQPPLYMVIQNRRVETLSGAGRFEEAEEALKKAGYSGSAERFLCDRLLDTGRLDEISALQKDGRIKNLDCEVSMNLAARFARKREDQKALDTAGKIGLDGWQNAAYREIVREQLRQDRYEDALQTFRSMNLLRFKQETVGLFIIWLLEKNRSGEAAELFERFLSQADSKRLSMDDPFDTTPKEWTEFVDSPYKAPMTGSQWEFHANEIAKALGFNFVFRNGKPAFDPIRKDGRASAVGTGVSQAKGEREIKNLLDKTDGLLSDDEDAAWKYEYKDYACSLSLNAAALAKANRNDEAAACLDRARRLCRKLRPCWPYRAPDQEWNLAIFYLFEAEIAVGQLTEAGETIKRLNVSSPETKRTAHQMLAEALFKADRKDDAQEHGKSALTFSRRAGQYQISLVAVLAEIGLTDEARSVLEQVEAPSPLQKSGYRRYRPLDDVDEERKQLDFWKETLK